jgi:hypothetical protein
MGLACYLAAPWFAKPDWATKKVCAPHIRKTGGTSLFRPYFNDYPALPPWQAGATRLRWWHLSATPVEFYMHHVLHPTPDDIRYGAMFACAVFVALYFMVPRLARLRHPRVDRKRR